MKQLRATLSILALSSLAALLYTASAHAVAFNPGRIIDDVVFTNTNTMTVADISAFLNSKVPACDTTGTQPASDFGRPDLTHAQYAASRGWSAPPYTCLKDYSENSQSSAQIIYNSAQQYKINPQVFIVLLQKETGLVTDTWPLPWQYKTATGYGCPDSTPGVCDSSYYGFTNQINWAARLFRSVLDQNPSWYSPYIKGLNYVQWSPTASCGGGNVDIQNWSTAALYDYTPYQPNPAALNAGYGMGDSCSAYGNRNFFLYFNDWFGSTTTSIPYAWQYVTQAAYLDANYTQKITYGDISVQPGQTIYLEIQAKNIGYRDWDANTHIGTSRSNDRTSIFASSNWLGPQRPTGLINQLPVTPSNTGTFRFAATAPTSTKSFREYFNLVQDGVMWMNDPGLYFNFNVTPVASKRSDSKSTLGVNGILKAGQYLLSDDANTALYMTQGGNLVLLNDMLPIWSSATAGHPGSYAILQADGNFVVYSKAGAPLWNSGTSISTQSPVLSLALQSDANLVLSESGTTKWSTNTATAQSQHNIANTALIQGGTMLPGQRIETADRTRTLIFQGDGNLVLYSATGTALWNTGTNGEPAAILAMQTDGNLVLYDDTYKPLWSSRTDGRGLSYLRLQDDSNLVLYRLDARPIWATMTDGK